MVVDVRHVQFSLALSAEECQMFYNGSARQVIVRAHNGLRVQLPSRVLQPFVEHRGVFGEFEVGFTSEGKFHSIRRLDHLSVNR